MRERKQSKERCLLPALSRLMGCRRDLSALRATYSLLQRDEAEAYGDRHAVNRPVIEGRVTLQCRYRLHEFNEQTKTTECGGQLPSASARECGTRQDTEHSERKYVLQLTGRRGSHR